MTKQLALDGVIRSSTGALFDMPFAIEPNIHDVLNDLKTSGLVSYGADTTGRDIRSIKVKERKVLVLGSEERIPKAQVLIPVITPEQAARKIVRGVAREKGKIRAPFMMIFIEFLTYWTPFITRFIMDQTGYRRNI